MFRRESFITLMIGRGLVAVSEERDRGGSDITITIEPSIIDLGIAVILVW